LSVVILLISREEGGIAGLQCSRRLLHKGVVDAEIGQSASECAGSSANRSTG
jgi:hypothetical protein